MKKAGIILLALGLITVSATILIDWLSSDGKKGFGAFPALFLMLILVTVSNFLIPYADDNPSNSIL